MNNNQSSGGIGFVGLLTIVFHRPETHQRHWLLIVSIFLLCLWIGDRR